MRIAYVAKHRSGGNDDEGAIAWALSHLGHHVVSIQESEATNSIQSLKPYFEDCDLCLFHKWDLHSVVPKPKMKRVFWWFDLVSWPSDPTLSRRCNNRLDWMSRNVPLVDMGFCTDGDFAATSEKLVHLPQGFDTRQTNLHNDNQDIDLFFAGISKGGGTERERWVKDVGNLKGSFLHVEKGVHGQQLADVVARSKICLCPSSPVTDRYCSNRIYNMLGYGGFVLHPKIESLISTQYNSNHLAFYETMPQLMSLVDYWLPREKERRQIAECGRQWTFIAHSYLRRCEILLEHVEHRLGVK